MAVVGTRLWRRRWGHSLSSEHCSSYPRWRRETVSGRILMTPARHDGSRGTWNIGISSQLIGIQIDTNRQHTLSLSSPARFMDQSKEERDLNAGSLVIVNLRKLDRSKNI